MTSKPAATTRPLTDRERVALDVTASEKLSTIPPPYADHDSFQSGIKSLHKDMVLEVIKHLDLKGLLSCRRVCKTWNHFTYLAPVTLHAPKNEEKFFILTALFPSVRVVEAAGTNVLSDSALSRMENLKNVPSLDLSVVLEQTSILDQWRSVLRSRIQLHTSQDHHTLVVKYATLLITCNKAHEWKDFYNRGNAYVELRKYAEAQADYQQILLLRPSIPDGYRAMGGLFSAKSDYATALKWLSQALERAPNDFDVLDYRARIHQKFGFFKDALADYDKMLSIRPKNTRIMYARGSALHEVGRYEEAVAEFTRALATSTDKQQCGPVHFRRGRALDKLGRSAEAQQDYQKALETKAILGRDWNAHGQIFALKGKHEEALKCFDKALTLLPDIPEYLIARARSFLATSKYAEAALDLSHAAELVPHDKEIQRERDEAIAIRNKHQPQVY